MFSLNSKRLKQRTRLGIRYVTKYLMDGLFRTYYLNYSPFKPLDVLCEITYNCNLRCETCFRWTSKPDEAELRVEDWENIIVKLKNWIGVFNLGFAGGEPFLRADVIDIIKFASDKGIVVSAVSNGSLIDEDMAEKIISSGLDALTLSLNSLTPEIHNKTRGTESSFNEVMTAVENLRNRKGMLLTISTTVMKENISELVKLVEFVKCKGLDGINFQPLMMASTFPVYDKGGQSPKYSEGKLYNELGANVVDVDNIFERLVTMKYGGYPINNSVNYLRYMSKYLKNPLDPGILSVPCNIGSKNFFIDPFGNVRICMVMEPIGNLAESPPSMIWSSEKARMQREEILRCHKTCRLLNCNFKEMDLGYKIKSMLNNWKK